MQFNDFVQEGAASGRPSESVSINAFSSVHNLIYLMNNMDLHEDIREYLGLSVEAMNRVNEMMIEDIEDFYEDEDCVYYEGEEFSYAFNNFYDNEVDDDFKYFFPFYCCFGSRSNAMLFNEVDFDFYLGRDEGDDWYLLELSVASGHIMFKCFDYDKSLILVNDIVSYFSCTLLPMINVYDDYGEYLQAHRNNLQRAYNGNIKYEVKMIDNKVLNFEFDLNKLKDDKLLCTISKMFEMDIKNFHRAVVYLFVNKFLYNAQVRSCKGVALRKITMCKLIREWIKKYEYFYVKTLHCALRHYIIRHFAGMLRACDDCDQLWSVCFAEVCKSISNQKKRIVKRQAIVAQGQMFEWMKNIKNRVTQVFDAVAVAPELVKIAKSVPMESITKLADSTHVAINGLDKVSGVIASIVEYIRSVFVTPIFSLVESGMRGIAKCVGKLDGMFRSIRSALCEALAIDGNSKILKFFTVFFFLVFVSMWITKIGYVTELIRDVVELSSEWLFGRRLTVSESFEGQSFPIYNRDVIGQSLGQIELFGTMVSMGIFLATGTKLNAPSFARNCITWGSILESICNFCPNFINACCKVVGLPSVYGDGAAPELIEFINDVISVVSDPKIEDAIHNDQSAADRVKELYGKLRMYRAYMIDPSMSKYFNGHLANIIIKKLEDLFVEAKTASPEVHDRPEPIGIMLPGPPNQGKSLMMELMPMAIYALLHSDPEFKDQEPWKSDWSFLKCYTRDQISEYWDKYTGQAFTHYNDIFQSAQSVDSSKIALELILAIDRASYSLNSAAVNDKGLKYFTSKFVMMTANKLNPMDFGIKQPDALVRRFHFCFEPKKTAEMDMKVMEYGTSWEKMMELDRCWSFSWANLHSNDTAILKAHSDARKGTGIDPKRTYRFIELCTLIKECYVRRAKGLDGVSIKNFGMDQLVENGKWKNEAHHIKEVYVNFEDEEQSKALTNHVSAYYNVVYEISELSQMSVYDFKRCSKKDKEFMFKVFDKTLRDNDLTFEKFRALDFSFKDSMHEAAYNSLMESEEDQVFGIKVVPNDDEMRERRVERELLQNVLENWNVPEEFYDDLPEEVSSDENDIMMQPEGQMFESIRDFITFPKTFYEDLKLLRNYQDTTGERVTVFNDDRKVNSIRFGSALDDFCVAYDPCCEVDLARIIGEAYDCVSVHRILSALLHEPNYCHEIYQFLSGAKVDGVVDPLRLSRLMRYVTAYVKFVLDAMHANIGKVRCCESGCLPNQCCILCEYKDKTSYVLNPVESLWLNKFWAVETFQDAVLAHVIIPVEDALIKGTDFGSLLKVISSRLTVRGLDTWDFTVYAGKSITMHVAENGQKFLSDGYNNLPTFTEWVDSLKFQIGQAYTAFVNFDFVGSANSIIANWTNTMFNSGPLGVIGYSVAVGLVTFVFISAVMFALKYMMVGLFMLIQKVIGCKNKLFDFVNFKKEDGNFDGQSFTSRYNHVVKQRPTVVYKAQGNMGNSDGVTRLLSNLYDLTYKNSRMMDIICSDGEVLTTHLGMVDNRQGFFVKHAWLSAKCVESVKVYGPDGNEVGATPYRRAQFDIREEEGRDVVFITFKECLPFRCDNIKHRIPVTSPTHCENAMRLMKQNNDNKLEIGYAPGKSMKLSEVPCFTKVKDPYGNVIEVLNHKYFILKNCVGANGACGFFVVSLDSRDQNRPFVGFHSAGIGGDSVVCPIVQGDFDMEYEGQSYDPYRELFREGCNDNMSKGMDGVSADLRPTTAYMSPHTTCLKPSCLSEFLPEEFHLKAPAKLSPFQLAGSIVSPTAKFHKKYSQFPGRQMPDQLWRMRYSPELYEGFEPVLKGFKHEWCIIEDVLFGNPDKGIESMEVGTASGFGLKHQGAKRGDWFDKKTRWIHPLLRSLVAQRVSEVQRGVCYSQVVIDCLKDELRDLARVAEGKTRVFCVGEFVACIVCKMFFVTYMREVKAHRSEYTCAVGTNPHAYDWTHLGRRIFQHGRDRVFGGDLPTMDISTQRYLAYLAACYLRVRMNLDEEGFRSCVAMMYNIVTTIHVCGAWSYYHEKGNSSGNWLTSWFNSFCCHVYVATCYYYLRPATCEARFVEYIALCVYGDDNLGSVHPECDFFDNVKLAQALKELFGLDFTNPAKGEIVDPWLPEDEQVFLARRFVWFEGAFLAPLDFESLDSMLCWERYHSDLPANTITSQNVEVYKQELAHYVYDIELRNTKWKYVSQAMYKAGLPDIGQTLDYWVKARKEGHYDTWYYKY